jgi:hypothetical protein
MSKQKAAVLLETDEDEEAEMKAVTEDGQRSI